jgi:hypothetical protein
MGEPACPPETQRHIQKEVGFRGRLDDCRRLVDHPLNPTYRLDVETGLIRYVPVQRTLSPEEITTAFLQYRKDHPIFSRMICRIPGWKWDSSYEEFFELARTLHGVAFTPKA